MQKKTKKTVFTKETRQEIWQQLTPRQQKVLNEHVRYRQTSLFTNHNLLGEVTDWIFVAYHLNVNYDDLTQTQLYCDCGRRLKHQYWLKNKTSGKVLRLGINHFADHANIPEQVMHQLQMQIHQLNFGLDETLRRYRRGVKLNPEIKTWLLQQNAKDYSPFVMDYAQVNLPLSIEDTQLVRSAFGKYQRAQNKLMTPQTKRTRRTKKVKRAENQAKVDLYLKAFDW